MKKLTLALSLGVLFLFAGSAFAVLEPPHDASNNVSCSDCHLPYSDPAPTQADIETKCESCHNPTGPAWGVSEVGMHQGIGCGVCHNPHMSEGNLHQVRAKFDIPVANPAVVFQNPPEDFVRGGSPDFNGVCENCHTQTDYYRRDGSQPDNHCQDSTDNNGGSCTATTDADCTSCHSHGEGFGIPGFANAGPDQNDVGYDAAVTLNGSGSVGAVSYAWVQVGGDPVVLTGADTANPTFTTLPVATEVPLLDEFNVLGIADKQIGEYTFQVTVDNGSYLDTDTVVVRSVSKTRGSNPAVGQNTRVYLNGGATTSSSPITNWAWTITYPDASTVSLSGRTPSFLASQAGAYTVTAVLTRASGTPNPVTKSFTVNAGTYLGAGFDPAYANCKTCHNGTTARDEFVNWRNTAHAQSLSRAIDGNLSPVFQPKCAVCHTMANDASADNNGFDDVAASLGWPFPEILQAGNWDDMVTNYPTLAAMGNIQCEACHGPAASHASTGTATLLTTPFDSETCGSCHMTDHQPQYPEWRKGAHFGPPTTTSTGCTCHTAQQNGGYPNTKGLAIKGVTCEACHDAHSATSNPSQLRFYGNVTLANGQVLSLGVAGSCATCHKDRRNPNDPAILSGRNAPHHSVQTDVAYGKNFIEFTVPGYPAYANSAHATVVAEGCVQCHMEREGYGIKESGGHTFEMVKENGDPDLESCLPCHAGLTTFDKAAYADYDGDGAVEGTQDEVEGLLLSVKGAIETKIADAVIAEPAKYVINCSAQGHGNHVAATIADASGRILLRTSAGWLIGDCNEDGVISGTENNSRVPTGANGDLIWKAAYNYYRQEFDGSFGVHNTSYTVQILQRTYYALLGVGVPGATIR
jgi:hypothetical protein